MSAYGGPLISSNGLIFFLDSANPKSYPGSGTLWSDISGYANNTTLINSVGFTTLSAGTLVFNGTNSYAEGNNSATLDASTSMTIACWVRPLSFKSNMSIVGKGSTSPSGGWDFRIDGDTNVNLVKYGVVDQRVFFPAIAANNWYHICACQGPLSVTYYINGSSVGVYPNPTPFIASTANLRISRDRDTIYTASNIGQIAIYSRILDANEIQQNFNALRGRFGV